MAEKKEIKRSLESLVNDFFQKLARQLAGWLELGELYIKIISEYPQQGSPLALY